MADYHRGISSRTRISNTEPFPGCCGDLDGVRFPAGDDTLGVIIDQAAGIVWRYQDPNNYYIVRANALENNVVLYKVENGIRVAIAPKGRPSRSSGVKHPVPGGWNVLRVLFRNSLFTVFLNGERRSKQFTIVKE